ncbi:ATP-binding protein [uncultured Porphyromonas sp.]|uniref:ATP-binding protein n=1 Tax=uncultured Porphyromonas sp. TaxID=159274 RepID=UPI0026386B15|nr:ATP-binding protein [uncultured Porphyromonas sp.]
MSLIKRYFELETPSCVKMMIYGQSGMGKTTLALSAPRPLLIDFDGGVKRVNLAHVKDVGTVQVASWSEVQQVLQEDLSDYDSIVVDTAGKMMDFIITHVCGFRQPQLRDWGTINLEAQNFIRSISALNKNIVIVAHRDVRKEGDTNVFIPALREKNYNTLVTELDLLGYMETKTDNNVVKRSITFDPTPRNDGKNTCGLPSVMFIPEIIDRRTGHATAPNNFIQAQIIEPYKAMIEIKRSEAQKYEQVMTEIREAVELVTDEVSANDFVQRIDEYDHVGSSKQQASLLINEKAKALGLTWNKKDKRYEPADSKK